MSNDLMPSSKIHSMGLNDIYNHWTHLVVLFQVDTMIYEECLVYSNIFCIFSYLSTKRNILDTKIE